MKKIIAVLAASTIFFFFSQPVQAIQAAGNPIMLTAGSSAVLKNNLKQADNRAVKLKAYLASHNSPLTDYADQFVNSADQYQIDWKLVPAITGVESTFGKRIPFNSYNAYGWSNGAYQFESWEQSIDHVSKFLKEKYLDRGLDTPQKINPVYAPPSPDWGWKVAFFMEKIENFGRSNHLAGFDLTI